MAQLFNGQCNGKVNNPEVGLDSNNKPRVRWEMEVVDGEHAGKRASYSGKLDPENIKFTKKDMMTIGWQGKDVRTFAADVKAAAKVVPFTAEIASYKRDDGSVSEWTSAKFGAARPLSDLGDKASDVNRWFAEVDGGTTDTTAEAPAPADIPF